ncbi:MAG: histidine--tRNA ligase [Nitrospirae bacterium]|nr:histidine--tRNA ligase [Nitrospirota bacterium]
MKRYSAVKGVADILPPDTYIWQEIQRTAREVFFRYGFQELIPPVMEFTDIFVRSIGETTDIVEKEMYTFNDRAGRSITLRPEGTAGIVRCYVEKNLFNLPQPQKFFYSGPMFRYERPQKGRQRQFYQLGAEAFSVAEPQIDAEILSMLMSFFENIRLDGFSLELNSIGCKNCRPAFRSALIGFFSDRLNSLCPDCKRRYTVNPLRILDCKVDACMRLRKGAPLIPNYLCTECKENFSELVSLLDMLTISYKLNPEMVRGLDYYTRTAFEVTCASLGAQNAVAAGGRYDTLVEEFGGPPTPAIGFAIGIERIAMLLKDKCLEMPLPDVFIATIGKEAKKQALKLSSSLRAEHLWVELGYEGGSLRSQMRRADRVRANYVFIIGDEELKEGRLKWKDLKEGSSGEVAIKDATEFIKTKK